MSWLNLNLGEIKLIKCRNDHQQSILDTEQQQQYCFVGSLKWCQFEGAYKACYHLSRSAEDMFTKFVPEKHG